MFPATRVHNPKGIFAQLTTECRRACPCMSFRLKIAPSHKRDLDPHLIRDFLSQREPTTKRHLYKFSRLCTAHRSVVGHARSRPFPEKLSLCMGIWTPSNAVFGPTRDHSPNNISIVVAVFAQLTSDCHCTLQWAPVSP